MTRIHLTAGLLGFAVLCGAAQAQSTGRVLSPDINPGVTVLDMRAAFDLDANRERYRLHVQHGWSARWRGRLVVLRLRHVRKSLRR
ncbi:MAG: hypothetical protein CME89_13450 [Hirschia sp.]|nr:hypothetical protein [Hirschia sp.]